MPIHAPIPTARHIHRLLLGVLLAGLIPVLVPASGQAAVTTFGSPLSVPATLNTAENLAYQGTNTLVYPSPEAPNGVVHTYHFGADAALWNVTQAVGDPLVPATGQALKVSIEGCAVPAAPGGPPPLTQIHLQDITPLPGGGARVNLTSQPFDTPVCGENGAGGSTVTTYEPINLCVSAGDSVALNEEGGSSHTPIRAAFAIRCWRRWEVRPQTPSSRTTAPAMAPPCLPWKRAPWTASPPTATRN